MLNIKDLKKQICAGITLYKPNQDDIDNIIYYSTIFHKVYIYDNNEEKYKNIELLNKNNIIYITNNQNDGLGIACNKLCEIAKMDGYHFIVLFDQDSRIDKRSLDLMYESVIQDNGKSTIYCPQIVLNNKIKNYSKAIEYVNWCITSGSLISLIYYGDRFKFDEKYFIDRLDKDLCEQILKNGEKICRVNNAYLHQRLGEKRVIFNISVSTHQPIRHYYIARNRLYYNRKFKKNLSISVSQTVKHILQILLWEDKKILKCGMIIRGISDYKKGVMGKMKE